jgi:hypothetical protein
MSESSDVELRDPRLVVAAIESATKNLLQAREAAIESAASPGLPPVRYAEYPVADLVGRCFLRVCFWADVFASWARRERSLRISVKSSGLARDGAAQDGTVN